MDIQDIRRKRLRQWFENRSLPPNEKSYLSQLLSGRASFGERAARRIEKDYGMGNRYLDRPDGEERAPEELQLAGNPNFPAIRRVRLRLSAGITGYAIEHDDSEEAPIVFRADWLAKRGYRAEKLLAVGVTGDSMEPTLNTGDTVVINTADVNPHDGGVFAVNYEGELVIKRIVRDTGEWWLSSDNQDRARFPRKLCTGESCIIIGRIIHRQSEAI